MLLNEQMQLHTSQQIDISIGCKTSRHILGVRRNKASGATVQNTHFQCTVEFVYQRNQCKLIKYIQLQEHLVMKIDILKKDQYQMKHSSPYTFSFIKDWKTLWLCSDLVSQQRAAAFKLLNFSRIFPSIFNCNCSVRSIQFYSFDCQYDFWFLFYSFQSIFFSYVATGFKSLIDSFFQPLCITYLPRGLIFHFCFRYQIPM